MGKRRKRKTGRRRQGSKKRNNVIVKPITEDKPEGMDGFKAEAMSAILLKGKK